MFMTIWLRLGTTLRAAPPPYLERSVYYDELSEESVRELNELAEREGMKALQTLNRRARGLQATDKGAKDPVYRINFGLYFFHGRDDGESAP